MARLYSTLVIALLSVSAFAQFPSNNRQSDVTVSVRSNTNNPIQDARVQVQDLATGQIVASSYTNSVGVAELSVPSGNYEISASHGLYETHDRISVQSFSASVNMQLHEVSQATAGDNNAVSVAQLRVPGKARDELRKAQEAISKRKLDEADKHIARAIELYPHFAEAIGIRGILHLDRGETEAALDDFHSALTIDPSYATAYLAAGAAYNQQGKFDDAIRELDRGVSLSPASWQAYFELGKAKLGKKDYPAALRMLDKAQSFAPAQYPLVHLVKAHALLAMKDYNEAMTELQAFLEKSPQDPHAEQARNMLDQAKAFLSAQK